MAKSGADTTPLSMCSISSRKNAIAPAFVAESVRCIAAFFMVASVEGLRLADHEGECEPLTRFDALRKLLLPDFPC